MLRRGPYDYKFDYDRFMTEFPNRVVDDIEKGKKAYIDVLGNRTWNHLHALAEKYGCPACKNDFRLYVSGIHDLKNIELDKKIHSRAKFLRFAKRVKEAEQRILDHHHNSHGYAPEEREPIEPFGSDMHEPEGPELNGYANEEEGDSHNGHSSPPPFVPDEEFHRILSVSPQNVLKAISHYEGEYKAPSSLSDISFILSIPHGSHTDKAIDRALKNAPYPRIQQVADSLVRQGFAQKTGFGGYILTDAGRQRLGLRNPDKRFNIENGSNYSEMKGSEIGLIAGAEIAGTGTESLAKWYDTTTGATSLPLHNRLQTWLPVIGAVIILAAYKVKALKKDAKTQLGAVVYGAHLVSSVVDVATAAATPGVTFGFVPVRPTFTATSIQPGLTAAPTPGYNPMIGAGLRSNVF